MKPRRLSVARLSFPLAAALAALFSPPVANAATYYWDGGIVNIGSSPNGNGVSGGTAGNWNTTLTNWDQGNGLAHIAWPNDTTPADTDTAFFAGTAGAVTLTAPVTVGGLTFFSTSGYSIAAGAQGLTFGATNNTISLLNSTAVTSSTATISGNVGGSGNVILTSINGTVASTLAFTGATTGGWSGTTTLNANTILTLDGAANLNRNLLNTTGITLNGGSINSGVIANNANGSADRINNAANWTVNSGSFSWGSSNAGGTYAETIGSVSLNSGQMNFSLLGNLSSGSQTLTLGTSGVGLSQTGTAAVTFSNNATALNGHLTGEDRIRVFGITTETTAGEIIAPWATVGSAAGTQTDYAKYTSDGTYGYVIAAGATLTAPGQAGWGTATDAYQFAASETLTADRTAAALRSTGATPTLALGGFTLKTNGILAGNGPLIVSGTGALTATGTTGGNLYLTAGSNAITVSSAINDNGGAVTVVKNGSGNLTLSSITSNFSGGTVVNAGTLTWTANTNLGSVAANRDITVNGNATLDGQDGTSLDTLAVGSGGVANFNKGAYTFATTTGSGVISFRNTLASKTLNLGNASGFTGTIQALMGGATNANPVVQFSSIGDGVGSALQFGGGNGDSNQAVTMAYNGTAPLVFNNRRIETLHRNSSNSTARRSIVANNSTLAATWTINTNYSFLTDQARELELAGTNAGNNAFNGVISNGNVGGTVTLVKSGNGTWIVGGNNTYSGGTTLSAGTLNANAANALGTGNVTVTAGTLVIGAANPIADTAALLLPSATGKNLTMNANDTVGSLFLAGAQQPNGSYSFGTNAAAWMYSGSGILMVGSAAAQPIFWDLDGATAGAGGATPTGTWDAANTFWNALSDGTGSVNAWSAGATATFSAGTNATGTYTVTVDGTQDIGGLTFEEGNVTLSGGTALRLVSNSLASVASGLTATVSTSLTQDASARALTKIGAGTLILSGSNSFSGATTVSAGTLQLANTNALASSSGLSMATGTTLQLRSDTSAIFNTPALTPAATSTVTINVNNNGLGSNQTLTLGGTLNATDMSASKTINITGASNGYILRIGTVNMTNSTTVNGTGLAFNPTTADVSIGTFTVNSSTRDTFISLDGSSQNNSIDTITDITAGATQNQLFKGGTSTWTLGTAFIRNIVTISGGTLKVTGTLTVGYNTSRNLSINGGQLDYNSASAVTFAPANTNGQMVMNGGNLDNSSGAAINTSSTNPRMTWSADWTFLGSQGALSDLNLGTGAITMAANRQVTVTNAATNLTLNGAIATTTARLTKAGDGTLTLGGNNLHTGGTTITAGTLALGSAGAVGASGTILMNGGTLRFSASNTTDYSARLQIQDAKVATFDTNLQTVNFANALATNGGVTGGLTKTGLGTLTLNGTNTYTGATTVTNGTLLINGSTSTSSAVAVNGGTLGGTGTIGGEVTVAGAATLSPGASIQSLVTGALIMASTSNFVYEVADKTATGADLLGVNGALSLTGVNLNLTLANAALSGGGWTAGDKLTLISYIDAGPGITSGFTGYADGNDYTFGSNAWTFNYNDTTAGNNFTGDLTGTPGVDAKYVTMTYTVIPEPSSVALLGTLGAMLLLRRRR